MKNPAGGAAGADQIRLTVRAGLVLKCSDCEACSAISGLFGSATGRRSGRSCDPEARTPITIRGKPLRGQNATARSGVLFIGRLDRDVSCCEMPFERGCCVWRRRAWCTRPAAAARAFTAAGAARQFTIRAADRAADGSTKGAAPAGTSSATGPISSRISFCRRLLTPAPSPARGRGARRRRRSR